MALIHHVVSGKGAPPLVLVHGYCCAHSDYAAQIAHFSKSRQTVAVDLRGHGASPGTADECGIERYGSDVAEVMDALKLPPSVIVGHSMGCRVVVEAALQAPDRIMGVILLDGSQFSPVMAPVARERMATRQGFLDMAGGMFKDMFTAKSDRKIADAIVARAVAMPYESASKLFLNLIRYDLTRLETSLTSLKVPVMALQSTYSNEKRERRTMTKGQSTPYLEMLRKAQPTARIEIVPDTGHFPQLDEAAATNAMIESFMGGIRA